MQIQSLQENKKVKWKSPFLKPEQENAGRERGKYEQYINAKKMYVKVTGEGKWKKRAKQEERYI